MCLGFVLKIQVLIANLLLLMKHQFFLMIENVTWELFEVVIKNCWTLMTLLMSPGNCFK